MKLAKFDITCPIITWIVLHSVRATITNQQLSVTILTLSEYQMLVNVKKIMKTLNGGQYKIDT